MSTCLSSQYLTLLSLYFTLSIENAFEFSRALVQVLDDLLHLPEQLHLPSAPEQPPDVAIDLLHFAQAALESLKRTQAFLYFGEF